MGIRNEMEQLVRDEVARVRRDSPSTYAGCWCPLCETDVVALALTLLPPLYCRDDDQGHALGLVKAGKIGDAVNAALKRVALWPKHRPGTRLPLQAEVALVNYTYEVGNSVVGPMLGKSRTGCDCEVCRADTLAYALNRYPAKYGVVRGGRRSLHPTYIDFMRYELGMLVTQAARVVAAQPGHPEPRGV